MDKTKKILQEICYLLSLNNGRMNLIKIIKELYLADRLSIDEREYSISGDTFYSMKNGPVLSLALDLLTNDLPSFKEIIDSTEAADPQEKYYPDIILISDPGQDRLSKNDKKYLEHISKKYKNKKAFEVVDETHLLKEWTPLKNGRERIPLSSILKALGRTDDEIAIIEKNEAQINRLNIALSGVCCE